MRTIRESSQKYFSHPQINQRAGSVNSNRSLRSRQEGSVLLVALLVCVILGFLMGSYLTMVKRQRLSVARGQRWNSAITLAEAGVEEALAHLCCTSVSTNNLAVNGWLNQGGGVYQKTNNFGDGSYKTKIIVTNNVPPLIVSEGIIPGPIGTTNVVRKVQVRTDNKPGLAYPAAMVVFTTLDMSGQGISTDSFNSTDTNYSTGGLYDAAKAMDHGDVNTLSSVTNAVQVDNGKVKGSVHTAPNGVAQVGSGGSVGDKSWVDSGKTGVQSGHAKADMNASYPDVALPAVSYYLNPVAGSYKISGTTYKYLLNNSSPWTLKVLDNSLYVKDKNTILYVTDGIAIGSHMEIRIAAGASLKLYMGGPDAKIGGNGVINETGVARNFCYFGLPTNLTLDMNANAAVVGNIYAPEAYFTLGGGGKNDYDFVGASVTKSAKMNGHYHFHYDEDLKTGVTTLGYAPTSWDEL